MLSTQYPNTVILQLRGGFYNAFDDSAIVLSEIMDYKLNQSSSGKYKSGFPVNVLDKVLTQFKNHHVNTIVFDNEKIVDNIDFEDNSFINYVDEELLNKAQVNTETTEQSSNKDNDKNNVNSYLSDINFLTAICNGRNPYTNEPINTLDLNNINTIRTLYRIRDGLMNI